RTAEHSSFRRSQDYAQGRRVRDSREMRAMARGTAFGRQSASGSWARTEFDLLSTMWGAGLPVPYPVQIVGTEACMEYIGDEGDAAPVVAPARGAPVACGVCGCLTGGVLLRTGLVEGMGGAVIGPPRRA
ncbi:MAG: hypothetical protein L0K65_07835, partial [Actinomyces sp.]|nr:hypothetical protein [Actinomyces sp.]